MTSAYIYNINYLFIRFMNENKSNDGWVVKTPFTTHASPYRGRIFCKTEKDVMMRILRLSRLSNGLPIGSMFTPVISLPYLMIQPRVNNTEYKILLCNGSAKSRINTAHGFKSSSEEIFEFAERVTKRLKDIYPETMTEYIMRVDIFEVYIYIDIIYI